MESGFLDDKGCWKRNKGIATRNWHRAEAEKTDSEVKGMNPAVLGVGHSSQEQLNLNKF